MGKCTPKVQEIEQFLNSIISLLHRVNPRALGSQGSFEVIPLGYQMWFSQMLIDKGRPIHTQGRCDSKALFPNWESTLQIDAWKLTNPTRGNLTSVTVVRSSDVSRATKLINLRRVLRVADLQE